MKKITTLITALIVGFSALVQGAEGESFQVGKLCYEINYDDKITVSVTFPVKGDIVGYTDLVGDLEVPSSVTFESKNYRVTRIGDEAFQNCTRLISVKLPDGITEIGYNSFSFCQGLKHLNIPNSVVSIGGQAFWSCYELADIVVPKTIREIGRDAFRFTAWYENHPDGVVCVNNSVYTYKGYLPEDGIVRIEDGVEAILNNAFYECKELRGIVIPNSVTRIGDWAFRGCENLESLTLSNSVVEIGEKAFNGCAKLNAVNVPSSVVRVGKDAFYKTPWYNNQPNGMVYIGSVAYAYKGEMPQNTEIRLKEGTAAIVEDAFMNCYGLKSIYIPNTLKLIGDNAFSGCGSLTEITLPDGVTAIGGSAFNWCSSLSTVAIPNSVKKLGAYAFANCSVLSQVRIGSSVEVIDASTFQNCKGVLEVGIPNSVRRVGFGAFDGCSGLAKVTISESVTEIERWAFHGCNNLTEIMVKNSNPPVAYPTTFGEEQSALFQTAKLIVPVGAGEKYKSLPVWSKFKNVEERHF